MPAIPHVAAGSMSPTQAAHIAGRARKLLRAGRLTPHDFAVLDALLWASRKPGADRAAVSYSRLQGLAHVARATVVQAIGRFVELGLVQRVKHRVLTLWNNGGRQWRQLANEYRFHCEFTGQPEYQKEAIRILKLEPSGTEIVAAQTALAERRREIEARLLGKGSGSPIPVN